ncbi:hypothetical protein ROG8370_03800 [Roseovarius gaetbuli]|uniref:Uncharacterized protein n=1 Tax=Roseovarius gaetbuli TaxID=1356575 RepID=A0A1X7ACJ0_9RHOB|nr:hypothetical protein ROG8370_03800 [Roseovarius gaetbuli]
MQQEDARRCTVRDMCTQSHPFIPQNGNRIWRKNRHAEIRHARLTKGRRVIQQPGENHLMCVCGPAANELFQQHPVATGRIDFRGEIQRIDRQVCVGARQIGQWACRQKLATCSIQTRQGQRTGAGRGAHGTANAGIQRLKSDGRGDIETGKCGHVVHFDSLGFRPSMFRARYIPSGSPARGVAHLARQA